MMQSIPRALWPFLFALALQIVVPMTFDDPSATVQAALWTITGLALLGALLTYEPITVRVPFIRRRRLDDRDRELPERNDRRDLADDLDAYADRMADWLDARDAQAPHIIDENTAAILGTKTLGAMLRIAGDDPERWEAHQQASAHYKRVTRTEYIMGWRRDALALFDQAMESGVIAPKIRERFENPDALQLHALPDVLRKLAERLRVQAADRLLSQLTIGHLPNPMHPRRGSRAA